MNRIYYILFAALLFVACSKEGLTPADKPLPPEGMAEVTLSEIRLNDADATFNPEMASATRAAGNLPEGSTLRLYAFKKGEADFVNKLATRTYTVDASGAAVLDAGQDPLYLPAGNVDIYLAGPTTVNTGTASAPIWTDVAGEWGITPVQDADLIAAYATSTIANGNTNPLPAMTLTHKMAKVQVVVSRHESGTYENMVVKEIKIYAQPQSGTYTLDATGGAITTTPDSPKADFIYPTIVAERANEKFIGTALLMPQPSKSLKIETTFVCNQTNYEGDNHKTLTYRQSGLIATALTAGSATRFTAAPLIPVEIKWRTTELPWNMVDQGQIIVPPIKSRPPVSDALAVLLDGYNEPKTIGGKLVWEDLGKAKNHAELMNDQVVWSSDGSYVFKNGGYMQLINTLPNSGVMQNSGSKITIEMVFVPDNGHAYPNEGLLRICNDLNAAPGEQIWKGNFSGVGYQGQSEYGGNSRWRILLNNVEASAGVPHSFVWANQRGGSGNNAFLDGTKYSGNGGSSAGYTYCVIGYACAPNSTNRNYFSGKIKAVRIHTRILTDAEIARNYEFDKGYYGL